MENSTSVLTRRIREIALITLEFQRIGVNAHTKPDKTLVSQVDLFVQAAITHYLSDLTPSVPILGEETPELLHTHVEIRDKIEQQLLGLGINQDSVTLLGRSTHTVTQKEFWCLDPIDGTRGFLRGDHYAIALARIKNGRAVQSFLCCPRLHGHGVIFTGQHGAFDARCLATGQKLNPHRQVGVADPVLIESLELGPLNEAYTEQLKSSLTWTEPNVRMDSQSKYGALTLGDAHCYLRPPRTLGAHEFSWDHAAGAHLVEMAGGRVTDFSGRPLDFSTGAHLSNNLGVLATIGIDHDRVLKHIPRAPIKSI